MRVFRNSVSFVGHFTRGGNERSNFVRNFGVVRIASSAAYCRVGDKIFDGCLFVRFGEEPNGRAVAASVHASRFLCPFVSMLFRRERGVANALVFPTVSDGLVIFGVNAGGGFLATVLICPATGRFEVLRDCASSNCRLYAALGDGGGVLIALCPAAGVSGGEDANDCLLWHTMVCRVVENDPIGVCRVRTAGAINFGLLNRFRQILVVRLFAIVVSLEGTGTFPVSGIGD